MQISNLQITPEGVMPIVHASQYDFGRIIKFYLYDGSSAYTPPTGSIINVEGVKSDGNAFSYSCTWSGNEVTVELTQQMTVFAETVVCELRIIDATNSNIGTINFKLQVEKSPIDGDTPVSETEIPAIIELAQAQADLAVESAKDSEAWAVGQREGTDVPSTDPTYHNNAKYYAGQTSDDVTAAQNAAKDSEAYAVGKRNGVDVGSSDPAYHNNAKYYTGEASTSATNAGNSATSAGADALVAEGYAAGSQNGTPVSSGTYYQNNSKYYKEQAANSATSASGSATSANGSAEDSEAWSQGTRNGTPVGSSDPTYENNAKYWAAQASGAVNDMTGATALTPGAHGLVPAPAAGDQNKYLKGDGTWGSLGTAAAKNSTNAVTQNSTDLVESGAVYSEIASVNSALSNKADATELTNVESDIAPIENGTNYSTTYSKGAQFIRNGLLYNVTASSVGTSTAITVGTNCALADCVVTQLATKQDKGWKYIKTVTGSAETSFTSGYSEYIFICGTPFYKSIYTLPKGIGESDVVFSYGGTTQQFQCNLDCYSYKVKITKCWQDGVDNISNATIKIYAR